MTDTIRLFVGTDPYQRAAERALECSVRRHTTGPVDITWMRAGEGEWGWGGWDHGWVTPFSLFRWFIPEACGFEGRAIYMDVDMLALTDLRELWEMPLAPSEALAHPRRPDVILWECSRAPKWTPPDAGDKAAISQWVSNRRREIRAAVLDETWDSKDKLLPDTRILHFTRMVTQPWRPYEHVHEHPTRGKRPFVYEEHPDPEAVRLWWAYAAAAADVEQESSMEEWLGRVPTR